MKRGTDYEEMRRMLRNLAYELTEGAYGSHSALRVSDDKGNGFTFTFYPIDAALSGYFNQPMRLGRRKFLPDGTGATIEDSDRSGPGTLDLGMLALKETRKA